MRAGEVREGYVIEHPNRDKTTSKTTKAIVVLLTVASAVLMAIVAIGGWDTLVGAKTLFVGYIILYAVLAYFIARWTRGALPLLSALAIILMIFAAVSIQPWFDRDRAGFTESAVPAGIMGLLCIVLLALQIVLIVFALRGFSQAWNVEVERPVERDRADRARPRPA